MLNILKSLTFLIIPLPVHPPARPQLALSPPARVLGRLPQPDKGPDQGVLLRAGQAAGADRQAPP